MNFIEAFDKMDKWLHTKSLRAYMHLSLDIGGGFFREYTCRRDPRCCFEYLIFLEDGKEITKLPASLFVTDKWEVLIKGESK